MLMQLSCGCCGMTPNNISILRYMEIVGPQAPAIPGVHDYETKAWTAATLPPQYYLGLSTSWFANHSTSETPTYIEFPSGRAHFVYYMHPMRYRISSLDSRTWAPITAKLQSTAYQGTPGYSSTLPPSTSHLSPLDLESWEVPMGAFQYQTFVTSPFSNDVRITHYRILVDGTDVSGIVAVASPLSVSFLAISGGFRGNNKLTFALTGNYTDKTVEVDLWVKIDTTITDAFGGNPNLSALDATLAANWQTAVFNFADTNKKRREADKYRLDFADNGIGGLSSLTLETGSGWTATNQAAAVSVSKAATGSVRLDWGVECPVIIYNATAKNESPSGTTGVVKYYPVDSGDYDGAVLSSGAKLTPGVWDARGSTTFFPAGRLLSTNGQYALAGDSASTGAFSGMFTGFPSSITVVKV